MDGRPDGELSTELAIVGTGPAGCATALALLQQDPGWARRMLLIDRAVHPRPKLCGGAITPLGLEALQALGLTLDVPHRAPAEMRIRFEGTTHSFFFQPSLRVVERAVFDAWLLERVREAGVRVIEGQPVLGAPIAWDGIRLQTPDVTLDAGMVVAADGSRGPMRGLLGLDRAGHLARLLEVFTEVSADERSAGLEEVAYFDFQPMAEGLQGYCWSFPSLAGDAPRMNHGVFDARVADGPRPASLERLLRAHMATRGLELDRSALQGHPIRWFDPALPLARPRAVLVGDAAGADPLLGEGISFALQFGLVGAAAVDDAFRRGDYSFADYAHRVERDPVLARLRTRTRRARWLYGRAPGALARALWRLGPTFMRLAYS